MAPREARACFSCSVRGRPRLRSLRICEVSQTSGSRLAFMSLFLSYLLPAQPGSQSKTGRIANKKR